MRSKEMDNIALNAIKLVDKFFSEIKAQADIALPPVLKNPGKWIASYDNSTLGVFYLDNKALQRVAEYKNKGWPPFPGFLISDDKRPSGSPVAVAISGSCNFFSSNRTSNMFAFSVKPGASFTVVDHFQEIRDVSGQEFKYAVDLAFVIGIIQEESWDDVEKRLHQLLEHSLKVWRNIV
jgi:hypothetical protein